MDRQATHPSRARRVPRWLARIVMTITAWPFAFLAVLLLFTIFRDELGSLSLATRALVVSGVLVTLMANVVIPVLSDVVNRSLERIVGSTHES